MEGPLAPPSLTCFSQALGLEGLSVKQDWVLRKASRRLCRENRLWGQ